MLTGTPRYAPTTELWRGKLLCGYLLLQLYIPSIPSQEYAWFIPRADLSNLWKRLAVRFCVSVSYVQRKIPCSDSRCLEEHGSSEQSSTLWELIRVPLGVGWMLMSLKMQRKAKITELPINSWGCISKALRHRCTCCFKMNAIFTGCTFSIKQVQLIIPAFPYCCYHDIIQHFFLFEPWENSTCLSSWHMFEPWENNTVIAPLEISNTERRGLLLVLSKKTSSLI